MSKLDEIIGRFYRKDTPEEEAEHQQVTAADPPAPRRKRGQALPMSYERRLASYGIRDITTGVMLGKQTPAQRRRIRHKIGHHQKRSVGARD